MNRELVFKKNDRRVKGKFLSQRRNRQSRRIRQFLRRISKDIVQGTDESKSTTVFEDLEEIHKLYLKGNGREGRYRRRL